MIPWRACAISAILPGIALLVLAAAAPERAQEPVPAGPKAPGGIAAIVNTEVITRGDLDRHAAIQMEETARLRGIDAATLERLRVRFEREVMDWLIEQQLLLQDAKKNDITTNDLEIDFDINRRIEKEYRPSGLNVQNADELYKVLKEKNDLTREEYRTQIRNEILINRLLFTKYFQEPFITPGEIRNYYDEHREEFETPSDLTFRMISLDPTEDAPRIMDTLDAALDQGKSFEEVARAFYQGQGEEAWLWKKGMGDLKSWMAPLPEVLSGMKPGEVKRRIRTYRGYRYIEMVDVKPGKRKKFEEVQQEIVNSIRMEYRIQERKRVVDRLKKEAFILDFVPREAAAAPAPKPKPAAPSAAEEPKGKVRDVSPEPVKPRQKDKDKD